MTNILRLFKPQNFSFILILDIFLFSHLALMLKAFTTLPDFTVATQVVKYLGIGLLILTGVSVLYKDRRAFNNPLFWSMLCYLLICSAQILFYRFSSDAYLKEAFTMNLKIVINTAAYFIIGLFFPLDKFEKNKNFLLLSWVVLVATDAIFIDYTRFVLNKRDLMIPDLWSSYLFWADSAAIIGIIVLGTIQKPLLKALTLVTSSFLLVALNSRAALISYIMTFLIVMGMRKGRKELMIGLGAIGLLSLSLIFFKFNQRIISHGNLLNDNSLGLRWEMLAIGAKAIIKSPFFGDFAGQFGEPLKNGGAYIHNYLSIWRQFGAVAFGLFLIFYFKAIRLIFASEKNIIISFLACFFILESTLFRAYTFPYFWIIAGYITGQSRYSHEQVEA